MKCVDSGHQWSIPEMDKCKAAGRQTLEVDFCKFNTSFLRNDDLYRYSCFEFIQAKNLKLRFLYTRNLIQTNFRMPFWQISEIIVSLINIIFVSLTNINVDEVNR